MTGSGLPAWLDAPPDSPGIGRLVDHTLLRPEVGRGQIETLCHESLRIGAAAVCVNGAWVGTSHACLASIGGRPRVRIAAVVGFPLGAMSTDVKVAEARLAIADGADEIDAVIPLGAALAGAWALVERDAGAVVAAAEGRVVKLILETAALPADKIIRACRIAAEAGARFVKSSTGFHPAGGATREAIALMRRTVGLEVGVKASGGIRTCVEAIQMLQAGANRIGTSSAASWDCVGAQAPPLNDLIGRSPPWDRSFPPAGSPPPVP